MFIEFLLSWTLLTFLGLIVGGVLGGFVGAWATPSVFLSILVGILQGGAVLSFWGLGVLLVVPLIGLLLAVCFVLLKQALQPDKLVGVEAEMEALSPSSATQEEPVLDLVLYTPGRAETPVAYGLSMVSIQKPDKIAPISEAQGTPIQDFGLSTRTPPLPAIETPLGNTGQRIEEVLSSPESPTRGFCVIESPETPSSARPNFLNEYSQTKLDESGFDKANLQMDEGAPSRAKEQQPNLTPIQDFQLEPVLVNASSTAHASTFSTQSTTLAKSASSAEFGSEFFSRDPNMDGVRKKLSFQSTSVNTSPQLPVNPPWEFNDKENVSASPTKASLRPIVFPITPPMEFNVLSGSQQGTPVNDYS